MLPMNVKGIIDNLSDALAYAPSQSKTARETFLRIMNRAQLQLVELAPYLFFTEEARVLAKASFEPEETDTLTFKGPNLYRRTAAYGVYAPWDLLTMIGRTVQIETPNGIKLDARIRLVFRATEGGVDYEWISLFESLPLSTGPGATVPYTVYDKNLVLPKNLVKLDNVVLSRQSDLWPAKIIEKSEAEYYGYTQRTAYLASADPYTVWRDGYYQLQQPTAAPVITPNGSGELWNLGQPGGKFEYCYTYGFGILPAEQQKDLPQAAAGQQDSINNFFYRSLFESAPSPISEEVTITQGGAAINIQLPSVDYEFGWASAAGSGLSDFKAFMTMNIYRRRKAVSGYAVTGPDLMGTTDHFELIYNGVFASNNNTVLVDRGRFPNKRHRLNYNHGHELLGIYPPPNDDYLLTIRGVFTPDILIDDTDTPKIKPEAMELYLTLCLAMWYERSKMLPQADRAYAKSRELLAVHAARFGLLMPDSRIILRRPVRGFLGPNRETRVWWGRP